MPRSKPSSLNRGELVLLAVMLIIIAYAIIQIVLQVIHMFTTPPSHPATMVVIPKLMPISLIAP
jgi:hypothetical protein